MIPSSSSCPYSHSSNETIHPTAAPNNNANTMNSAPIPNAASSPIIASRIHPDETPPTQAQIDIVRYTWERVCEIHLDTDDINVSASHAFGLAFYDALFKLDPSLKPLFTNVFQQARALAGMVSYIARAPNVTGPSRLSKSGSSACGYSMEKVTTIREINARKRKETNATTFPELVSCVAAQNAGTVEGEEELLHKLRELGARHFFYQVDPDSLALVGPAVLTALKARLGREFLPEVASAWTRAHAYAAYHMKAGLDAQAAWEQGRRKSATLKMNTASGNQNSTKSNCSIQ